MAAQLLFALTIAFLILCASSAQCPDGSRPKCERSRSKEPPARGYWTKLIPCRSWYQMTCDERFDVCPGSLCLGLTRSECVDMGFKPRNAPLGELACCIKRALPGCKVTLLCSCKQQQQKTGRNSGDETDRDDT